MYNFVLYCQKLSAFFAKYRLNESFRWLSRKRFIVICGSFGVLVWHFPSYRGWWSKKPMTVLCRLSSVLRSVALVYCSPYRTVFLEFFIHTAALQFSHRHSIRPIRWYLEFVYRSSIHIYVFWKFLPYTWRWKRARAPRFLRDTRVKT